MNSINIHFGQEELISRTPTLFAYIEFDEFGLSHLYPAHESPTGSYGKIPAGITIPDGVFGICDFDGYEFNIIEPLKTYSYKALMDYYFQYRDLATSDDTFMAFMERGIGKHPVDIPIDWNECNLVPEYVYLSECGTWYEKMEKMKITIEHYYEVKQIDNEVNCEMECLIDEYNRMGGDMMRNFYYNKWKESVDVSKEYLSYATTDLPVISLDLLITSKYHDLGYKTTYINYFVPGEEYKKGEIVTYNGRSYICTGETRGHWNPTYEEYEFDFDNFELMSTEYDIDDTELTGTTASKLNGFRRKKNYLNIAGSVETPPAGYDWLYYYRIGALGHYETTTDTLGNIAIMDGEERNEEVGSIENHLMAYGDIITDISYDEEERNITFKYVIGCNLKATLAAIEIDDDGNKLYKYDRYEHNADDTHGILCVETYEYESGGELEELIMNGDFDAYVRHDVVISPYTFYKMAFRTSENMTTFTTIYDGTVTPYNVTTTQFTTEITNPKDELVAPIMHVDYLTGISYEPHVYSEVYVNRGNASSWERHMKLGEIKTFEDLENYANGGFFNLQ